MTKRTFASGMAVFLKVIRNFKADKETQSIYYELLKDLTDTDFEFAITNILKTVPEIYPNTNFVALVKSQLKENNEEKAMLAWEAVVKANRKYGFYNSVKFSDPVIHSVIELMGGWLSFGDFQTNELKWKMKEFCDIYNTMRNKTDHPKYLSGWFESDNGSRGFEIEKPVDVLVAEIRHRKLIANK